MVSSFLSFKEIDKMSTVLPGLGAHVQYALQQRIFDYINDCHCQRRVSIDSYLPTELNLACGDRAEAVSDAYRKNAVIAKSSGPAQHHKDVKPHTRFIVALSFDQPHRAPRVKVLYRFTIA